MSKTFFKPQNMYHLIFIKWPYWAVLPLHFHYQLSLYFLMLFNHLHRGLSVLQFVIHKCMLLCCLRNNEKVEWEISFIVCWKEHFQKFEWWWFKSRTAATSVYRGRLVCELSLSTLMNKFNLIWIYLSSSFEYSLFIELF